MSQTVTRKDIDDVLGVLDVMMTRIDERFSSLEVEQQKTRQEIHKIINDLDAFIKRQEISDDERLVMGHQLDRLDRWTHELAKKIGYNLTT